MIPLFRRLLLALRRQKTTAKFYDKEIDDISNTQAPFIALAQTFRRPRTPIQVALLPLVYSVLHFMKDLPQGTTLTLFPSEPFIHYMKTTILR